MTVAQAFAKMDLRLNKVASGDYDNIWPYAKAEALNKAINEWVRRQKHGKNQTQEGDEETDMRVDDLQVLLKTANLSFRDKGVYVQTEALPQDYLYFKRISPLVTKGVCSGAHIVSTLREEANVDVLLSSKYPSFQFEETFHTLMGNKVNIYHNKDFSIKSVLLTYYRKPKVYTHKNLKAIIEFKDEVCDLIIDEACKILASDIESLNQKTLAQERNEQNN